ncbi:WXG100 family type VII secretion target [Nonomuraea cavernae]|uniref:ESAT-6-like protein n=1 Tax=Nonomuraea cavernae TaxID=2045107 RepID=A0A917ZH89_9ACTN|nr:WXG100 family type VII secretion target [Nonomuraea cavernae]MCA2190078.1 WXG100 family type VII secretion target [Nonomuraea cavernae]GGO83020.1 hypothetical protein GCM10012289_75610 [Nonomuraea cavernae]
MGDGLAPDVTRVNFGQMDAQADSLKGVVNQLDQITNQLVEDIKKAFAGNWDGGAKSFFDIRQAHWNTQEEAMRTALDAASTAVRTANGRYQETERKNLLMWDV